MCQFGCSVANQTYKCKYCGAKYCASCKKGEFSGTMRAANVCGACNKSSHQGDKV